MTFNAVNSLVNLYGQGVEDRIPEEWFHEINKQGLKILEIGFGKGSLLKRLSRADGPELYGIEASEQNYRHAIDVMKVNAHLNLADTSTERIQFPSGYFNVCVMLECLEHTLAPLRIIQEIQRVLMKDGILIFSFPEERLVSGIGLNCDQSKRSHGDGFHSFPYPGLFQYDSMRVLFNQAYFKIVAEHRQETYHVFFKMINLKLDKPEILDVVNGDYDRKDLYETVETPCKFPELSPFLVSKQ